jgi:hypothetical protein
MLIISGVGLFLLGVQENSLAKFEFRPEKIQVGSAYH